MKKGTRHSALTKRKISRALQRNKHVEFNVEKAAKHFTLSLINRKSPMAMKHGNKAMKHVGLALLHHMAQKYV